MGYGVADIRAKAMLYPEEKLFTTIQFLKAAFWSKRALCRFIHVPSVQNLLIAYYKKVSPDMYLVLVQF